MRQRISLILSGAAATCLTVAGIVFSSSNDQVRRPMADHPTQAIQEAIKVATKEFPGRVLEAEREVEDGTLVYEVTIEGQAGHTREFEVDAQSALILYQEHEHGHVHSER